MQRTCSDASQLVSYKIQTVEFLDFTSRDNEAIEI